MENDRTTIRNVYNDLCGRLQRGEMEAGITAICMSSIGWGSRVVLDKETINLNEEMSFTDIVSALREGIKMLTGVKWTNNHLLQFEAYTHDLRKGIKEYTGNSCNPLLIASVLNQGDDYVPFILNGRLLYQGNRGIKSHDLASQ